MRRLVSSAAALAADRAAEDEFGYPALLLMEEAAIRLQDALEALETTGAWGEGTVVYLSGPGNNGGDALAMARQAYLRGRTNLAVVRVLPPASQSCQKQDAWVRQLGLPAFDYPSPGAQAALESAVLWVDGLWGTGLSRPLTPEGSTLVETLARLGRTQGIPSLAIDAPSGLWAGWALGQPVLEARWSLAPGWAKSWCYWPDQRPLAGRLIPVPLAFPRAAETDAELLEPADLSRLLPSVLPTAYKGPRGHVAVVGGSAGMSGALVLASRAAAAAGAGLVTLGVDGDLTGLVAPQVPSFQVRPLAEALGLASRYDAWVVGPGWGRGEDRCDLLAQVLATGLPVVVDADGLAAWAALAPGPTRGLVLTPHPGEFARLSLGPGGVVERAGTLATTRGVTVVLKGAVTWILGPDGRRSVWDGSNPALGTGGSGDCLAGIIGALLAVGLDGYEAARAGVVLHGVAGQRLAQEAGWFTADRIPDAVARISFACRTGTGTV